MFTLIAENKYGQQLSLTQNPNYVIKDIDGLYPADAKINTTKNANSDGSIFNSSYVDNKEITITMAINSPAEINRLELYRYFKAKQAVKLYYNNEARNVTITGYVKSMPIAYFDKKQVAQIVIICPDPFFAAVSEQVVEFTTINNLFEFPFTIETPIPFSEILIDQTKDIINGGDVETGGIFVLTARGQVVNPIVYNVETNEYFKLNHTMAEGDIITINTEKNHKMVIKESNGVVTNLVGSVTDGSTWLTFYPSDNIYSMSADSLASNLDLTIKLIDKFEGV